MSNTNRHPLTEQSTPELRETVKGYEQKIQNAFDHGYTKGSQQDRMGVLGQLRKELNSRKS
jgi:flagellar biosynthesis/type III secretory pathway protein FliH